MKEESPLSESRLKLRKAVRKSNRDAALHSTLKSFEDILDTFGFHHSASKQDVHEEDASTKETKAQCADMTEE